MVDQISRRSFLRGVAGVGAAGAIGALGWEALTQVSWAQEVPHPVCMAMHVHSSFSEGTGSMAAQLVEATGSQVDVVWWTDHDWRMAGHGYRSVVHFSGLTETENGNDPLTWAQARSGSLASSSATIDTTKVAPSDPLATSSLRLAATGSGSSFATMRCTADGSKARENLKGTIGGQLITVDVCPASVSTNVFLEIRIKLSNQPASGGRAAGAYTLIYRLGGTDAPGVHRASGLTGYVGLGAPAGQWTTLTLTPTEDIALLWPDLLPADSTMKELSFAAGSRSNAPAVFSIGHLRFARTATPLEDQRALMDGLALRYPGVAQLQGSEVSLFANHLNWFGGGFSLPDYGTTPINPVPNDLVRTAALAVSIHDVGGLSSLNHPFGSGTPGLATQSKQDSLRRALATKLIGNRAYGVDILEVGYQTRQSVGIGAHLGLWDALSRNAIFLTGNGVNDNHGGTWAGQPNRFLTWAWAADPAEPSLLGALAAGRIWFAEPSFRGMVDLLADGVAPMGSVTVSDLAARSLQLMVTGAPAGGSVRLVRGPVDYAGSTVPDPNTVTQSFPAGDLSSGSVTVSIDTTASTFARTEILDATGRVVGGSNPIWLLRADPPGGIPAARAVAAPPPPPPP
ncbi:MAG: twin-arginine translocation signal domain-containing protein [Actinomycetota bacterium]